MKGGMRRRRIRRTEIEKKMNKKGKKRWSRRRR